MTRGVLYQATGACIILLITLGASAPSRAKEETCRTCHAPLTRGASVHKALERECAACHAELEARSVPHRSMGPRDHGLTQDLPGLCFGCHDSSVFTGKTVHGALGIGCPTCHDPHSSKNRHLLRAAGREVCFACHDRTAYAGTNVHAPLAQGGCVTCHEPHASDHMALLVKRPIEMCKQCHQGTPHGTHFRPRKLLTGSTGTPGQQEPEDPRRPGKPFYCGSCHDPHSTDTPLLFRFKARSTSELCNGCHAMN
ncbi:MAG: cytochrome c3 family protein [Nitrospirota bacterium]